MVGFCFFLSVSVFPCCSGWPGAPSLVPNSTLNSPSAEITALGPNHLASLLSIYDKKESLKRLPELRSKGHSLWKSPEPLSSPSPRNLTFSSSEQGGERKGDKMVLEGRQEGRESVCREEWMCERRGKEPGSSVAHLSTRAQMHSTTCMTMA